MTANNTIAIAGSEAYGFLTIPGVFDPPCDGYGSDGNGGTKFVATVGAGNTTLPLGELALNVAMRAASDNPYGLEVYVLPHAPHCFRVP